MRALFFAGLLVATGCTRTSTPAAPESNEVVFDDAGPFVRSGNARRIDFVYAPDQPGALLVVSWTTVADFLDQTHAPPQPDRFALNLTAGGHVSLTRQTAMRIMSEWTRYY